MNTQRYDEAIPIYDQAISLSLTNANIFCNKIDLKKQFKCLIKPYCSNQIV